MRYLVRCFDFPDRDVYRMYDKTVHVRTTRRPRKTATFDQQSPIFVIILGRPSTYLSADLYRFYRDFSICLSIFFRPLYPPSSPNGTQPCKISNMLGNKCDLKTQVRNLRYPLPLQIGGPKTTFSTTSQLNGNLNGLQCVPKSKPLLISRAYFFGTPCISSA